MNTKNTPPSSRIVAPAFIAVALGTLVGAVALAITFNESVRSDPADPGEAVVLDRSPLPALFSDSEYSAFMARVQPEEAAAPEAPAPRKVLRAAPAFHAIEAPVAVEVMAELATIEDTPAPISEERESARAAAVWADGASRARDAGRMDLAVSMLRNAVSKAPERHDYWVALAEAQTDSGEPTQAVFAWRRAAELSGR